MRALISSITWAARHPLAAAVIIGLVVATILGAFSFPRQDRIERTLVDWLPPNHSDEEAVIDNLLATLERARAGEGAEVVGLSEEQFREKDLPVAYAFPDTPDGGRQFVIRYVGKESEGADRVFLAERKVAAGPWWDPDHLLYTAWRAESEEFGGVLRLTFERDWQGLMGLFMLDMVIGAVYGALAGLILRVLNMKGLEPPGKPPARPIPPEALPNLAHPRRWL